MSDSEKLRTAYEECFSSDLGEKVLLDLMRRFHVGVSSHVSGDPHETAFREGERHVVLHILDMLGERGDARRLNDMLDRAHYENYEVYMRDD